MKIKILLSLLIILLCLRLSYTQTSAAGDTSKIMITVFLKHFQENNLTDLQQTLEQNGFYKIFPPEGAEIVSWYVMMGIGQIVTLKITPERLRDLNLSIEKGAWGAFSTEFYPTYDYLPIWKDMVKEVTKDKQK